MFVISVLIALGLVAALAAVVIGREARRLDAQPPRPVFDPEEAVEWVSNHLPPEATAALTFDEVRQIVVWNVQFLRLKGVSGNGSSLHAEEPVVVSGAETLSYVLEQARATGLDVEADAVQAVLDAQLGYFQAIGAIGPQVDSDDL